MYKYLRDIPNPYNHTSEIKDSKFFIGRKKEFDLIMGKIDDFLMHGQKCDFIITGDKSMGKSSFLNILKEKLDSKGILVARMVVTESKATDSLLFFKVLYDVIFDGGAKNDYLNKKSNAEDFTQFEIWERLSDNGEYEEFRDKSHLYFGKTYANSKKKSEINFSVSEVALIKDFQYLVNAAKVYDFSGIVILIDEFQLLAINDSLIQIIQRLMDEVTDIVFILAGNYSLKGDSFEKIKRKSEPIELLPLKGPNEIYDLIYKPLMKYDFTREEIRGNIDFPSFRYLLRKGEYNPYYVNLIMHHVFDRFKKGETEKLVLDHQIMFEIINKLKTIATHHERITSQLNASSPEQLNALYRLFSFQNINLDDIALLDLTFSNFSEEEYLDILSKIKEDIIKVIPLKLFEFENVEALNNFIQTERPSRNQSAEIKFRFDGDNIDELYLSQIIESKINVDFPLKSHSDIFEHFSDRLMQYLIDTLLKHLKQPKSQSIIQLQASYSFLETAKEAEIDSSKISEKVEILRTNSEKQKLSSEDYSVIQKCLSETNLHKMPFIAKEDDAELGYLYFFAKVKIRYKIVKFEIVIPVNISQLDGLNHYNEELFKKTGLSELYNIQILDSVLIPIQPKVIVLLKRVDLQDLDIMMMRRVYQGDFDSAINYWNILNQLEKSSSNDNNLGFLYMNKGDYQIASKYFNNIHFRDQVVLCNLAYLSYLNGNNKVADQLLTDALKKSKNSKNANRLIRIMNQILLPIEARRLLESTFDMILSPSEDIIIVGNKAIIASFAGQDHGIGLLKNAELIGELDEFYRMRYEYFIYYNLGKLVEADKKIIEAEKKIQGSKVLDYLLSILNEDKKIINLE